MNRLHCISLAHAFLRRTWLGMGVVEAAREGGALVSAVGEHASPSAERRSSHWEKSMRSVCSPRFTCNHTESTSGGATRVDEHILRLLDSVHPWTYVD